MSGQRPAPKHVGGNGDPGAPIVVFAHANGFPPETYNALLGQITTAREIWTVEHRPLWIGEPAPKRLSWHRYADDLLVGLAEYFGEPVVLVGHSMGGVCSLLAAANAPERCRAVVALDPVLLRDRDWWSAQMIGLINPNVLPIVQRALGRPAHFDRAADAFAFYRHKRAFQRLSDAVLMDYVNAGHEAVESGGVRLRWSGEWEACVYRSAPRMWSKLRRLKLPTMGIVGKDSDVLGPDSLNRWRREQPHLELHSLDAGHLVPLEAPEQCAQHINDFLTRLDLSPSHS